MNVATPELSAKAPDPRLGGVIKLAVMAVGGQGGGVLTNWVESLARSQGFAAQATSVAGVSQRTGATIYYVEMAPMTDGASPVFSLAPAGGDVDVLIAAEMMEAGRAIMRGFVTPDRTTLIASSHRALAVSEKSVPGDGAASSPEVIAACEIAAQRLILADMERIAVNTGSVISASLFGALAASGALPFPREAFEDAIRQGGKGVDASLRAFAAGFDAALAPFEVDAKPVKIAQENAPAGPEVAKVQWQALLSKIAQLPDPVIEMATAGARKVVGFQDVEYGQEYLDRLDSVIARDSDEKGYALSTAAAKYIANAMAYDDVIRVADLKTRRARFDRIRGEMGAGDDNLLHLTEFMHPRAEEIVGLLPAKLGARIEASPKWMARIDRVFNKSRRLRTDTLRGFIMLHFIGGMRKRRRKTLRHRQEQAHLDAWLKLSLQYVDNDYDLAVELIKCRRLIKGYSDTHARGLSKFGKVVGAAEMVAGRDDAAQWIARLREAALQDEKGEALDGALQTVASFAG